MKTKITPSEPPVLNVIDKFYDTVGIKFSTQDWFSRHEPLWNAFMPEAKPKRILEIGSYEGRSTCYMIKTAAEFNPLEIYCIDTWRGGVEHAGHDFDVIEKRFDSNMKLIMENRPHPVTLHKLKGFSFIELSKLAIQAAEGKLLPFDLIYIDGSHQASDVLYDAVMSFHLLKINGYLVFDDYRIIENPKTEYDIPTIAIDSFVRVYNNKLQTLYFQSDDEMIVRDFGGVIPESDIYQLYLQKIAI